MRLDDTIGEALAEDALTLACLHDAEASAAAVQSLKAVGFPDNLALFPVDTEARQGHEMMRAALAALPEDLGVAALDELAADYAAIYLTGAHGASPCESYWLSDDHLVCQDAMFELRKLYAASGLKAPDWRKRPDDHLVFQLQYLARRLQAAGTADDWRAIGGFLDHHLLRWLPDFAGRVAGRGDTLFYAALASLTSTWCDSLRELIAGELAEPRLTSEEIENSLAGRRVAEATEQPLRFMPGGPGPGW